MKRIRGSLLVATLPVRKRPRECTKVEERHGDPRLPARAAERSRQEIKGVLVEYDPGGYSLGHTHAKSAFIYATVLDGATRSQANDGPVTTYKARQRFSELPGDRHGVSANASKTKPAKLRDVSDEKTNAHGSACKGSVAVDATRTARNGRRR
jgi:quercetin dioxygenase-like cupin family protein